MAGHRNALRGAIRPRGRQSAPRGIILLKSSTLLPFSSFGVARQGKRKIMADPVGGISAASAAQYAVGVVRMQHDQQDVEGKQAVQLIQAASAPQLASSGSVGTKLNVVA